MRISLFITCLIARDAGDPVHARQGPLRPARAEFLPVPVGVSGADFPAAETGTVRVVESEDNGRMCTTLRRVTTIGTVLPERRALEVMLRPRRLEIVTAETALRRAPN